MLLRVCIGDFCHLNGSEVVVKKFQELTKDSEVQVELKGCFCMGRCSEPGVTVECGDDKHKVMPQDAEFFFNTVVNSQ